MSDLITKKQAGNFTSIHSLKNRSFQLPGDVEQKDGILKVTLPKSEKSLSKTNQIMIK